MNTSNFLTKLSDYLENRTGFLSAEKLNSCYNKFVVAGFKIGLRMTSSDKAVTCVNLFSDEELISAMLFVEQRSIFENMLVEESVVLNRFTFNNFKQKSVALFTCTGTFIRGTRYV